MEEHVTGLPTLSTTWIDLCMIWDREETCRTDLNTLVICIVNVGHCNVAGFCVVLVGKSVKVTDLMKIV